MRYSEPGVSRRLKTHIGAEAEQAGSAHWCDVVCCKPLRYPSACPSLSPTVPLSHILALMVKVLTGSPSILLLFPVAESPAAEPPSLGLRPPSVNRACCLLGQSTPHPSACLHPLPSAPLMEPVDLCRCTALPLRSIRWTAEVQPWVKDLLKAPKMLRENPGVPYSTASILILEKRQHGCPFQLA